MAKSRDILGGVGDDNLSREVRRLERMARQNFGVTFDQFGRLFRNPETRQVMALAESLGKIPTATEIVEAGIGIPEGRATQIAKTLRKRGYKPGNLGTFFKNLNRSPGDLKRVADFKNQLQAAESARRAGTVGAASGLPIDDRQGRFDRAGRRIVDRRQNVAIVRAADVMDEPPGVTSGRAQAGTGRVQPFHLGRERYRSGVQSRLGREVSPDDVDVRDRLERQRRTPGRRFDDTGRRRPAPPKEPKALPPSSSERAARAQSTNAARLEQERAAARSSGGRTTRPGRRFDPVDAGRNKLAPTGKGGPLALRSEVSVGNKEAIKAAIKKTQTGKLLKGLGRGGLWGLLAMVAFDMTVGSARRSREEALEGAINVNQAGPDPLSALEVQASNQERALDEIEALGVPELQRTSGMVADQSVRNIMGLMEAKGSALRAFDESRAIKATTRDLL